MKNLKGEKYPIYKSSCCGVGVSVSGTGVTQYYVCNKCDKACDFLPENNLKREKVNDPKGEALSKFLEDNGARVIDVTPREKLRAIKGEKKEKKCNHKWQAVPMNSNMANRYYMSGCEVIVVCTKCLEKRYI